MKHDNWPFNDANEPLCTAEQYAAEQRADAEYGGEPDHGFYPSIADDQHERADVVLEEIAERLGHYHLLTDDILELVDGGASIIETCRQALTAVEALAYLLGEPYLKHDLWPTDETPSPRLLEAAECLVGEFKFDAGYCARAFRFKEKQDAKRLG